MNLYNVDVSFLLKKQNEENKKLLCEIEDFVETFIFCKLCVTFLILVTAAVMILVIHSDGGYYV